MNDSLVHVITQVLYLALPTHHAWLLQSCNVAALEKFLAQAQLHPVQTTLDIVASYCKSSSECEEIFRFLEAGKKKPPEVGHCMLHLAPLCTYM